jgi:hypothetical protein
MLNEGDIAPPFHLLADDGHKLSLADLRGKHVALYFYPKASTPGCTTEAIEFRELKNEFDKLNAVVLGCSADRRGAGKVQGQAKAEFPAAERPGFHRHRGVWRASHEKFSRQIVSGYRAQHGPDRSRRESGEDLGNG